VPASAAGSFVQEVLADVSRGAEHIAAVVGETRDGTLPRRAAGGTGTCGPLERTVAAINEQEAEANAGGPAPGVARLRVDRGSVQAYGPSAIETHAFFSLMLRS
jgi:hypothetical protein